MQRSRVASWYWIICAMLTPPLLLATLAWAYYSMQSRNLLAEAERITARVRAVDAQEFEPMLAHMKEVSSATGFEMQDPIRKVTEPGYAGKARPDPRDPVMQEQEGKPNEDRNLVYRELRKSEQDFFGADENSTGFVHKYIASREWLTEFGGKVDAFLKYKAYQHYTVPSIEIASHPETAQKAGVDLGRSVEERQEFWIESEAAVTAAAGRTDEYPEKVLRAPTRLSMELIVRMQFQTISDLVAANHHQFHLLYAEVSESGADARVGFGGEAARQADFKEKNETLVRLAGERNTQSGSRLDSVFSATDRADQETQNSARSLGQRVSVTETRIDELANAFEAERAAHQADADAFDRLTRSIPRIKSPIKLEKRDADAEITYSDYNRRLVHIDLGTSDGVRAGQRFEIWRFSGRDADTAIGVIEIIRTLSPHFSLATVLSLVDEKKPVARSDKAISRVWHNGRFLTVALHGSFEPPAQSYSKERLTELLRQAGCRVVEKVQPGTDIVITGSNLLGDDWYRKAKDDLRFEALREEDVRIYVDPR